MPGVHNSINTDGKRGFMKQNDPRPPDSEKAPLSKRAIISTGDGIDLTLIRWMLSLTPTERLKALQQNIQSIMRLRGDKTDSRFFGNPKDSIGT
jgi:hypothetical protein